MDSVDGTLFPVYAPGRWDEPWPIEFRENHLEEIITNANYNCAGCQDDEKHSCIIDESEN